ncbi:MAG: hypothetical protein IT426_21180 [Pirellulales bacterium]|nr:hypothetical protein [Pirellulales bacterium]
MLYEFAVAPDAVSRWEPFRYLTEKFGAEHGRLISRLPKRWEDAVLSACTDCGPVEKLRITERLAHMKARLTRLARPYDHGHTWLKNAEDEYSRKPFRAIIAAKNLNRKDFVLEIAELEENTNCWYVPRELCVPRTSNDMANCVKGLFAHSNEILFVDPHFAPEHERYRATLSMFLRVAHSNGKSFRRIEYHLKKTSTFDFFSQECNTKLSHRLPQGVEITFIRWKELACSEELHPRYVLSELGGVRFERGLDCGEPKQTTDVSLLSEALHKSRWDNYQKQTAAFAFEDEVSITGTMP